jgi:small subunit ribosomal protein S5
MNGDREWVPKTRLGTLVHRGEIMSMGQALRSGLPLRESEVVDILLPDMEDEVLDVNMVQRMTDSGRRVKFSITVAVGNRDGYIGLGQFKGKEVGPSIRKAIANAKLKLVEVKRGCGSWECGCGQPHSLPYKVHGKASSVLVTLKPAPRGTTLATASVAKSLLRLAGFQDAWAYCRGQTRTTVNFAKATYNALENLNTMRVRESQIKLLNIKEGGVRI